MRIEIESNIMRYYLRNVYFINGTAYAGKSTMAAMLAEKYGMVHCGENYHLKNCDKFVTPEYQPCIGYFQTMKDWQEFINSKVNIIRCSGGALVAINVALEAPDLVSKVIADSFMGEKPLKSFIENVKSDRELSKSDEGVRSFYTYMHGSDWEQIVDNDTNAIIQHSKDTGAYFHKHLQFLKSDILLTGSKKDEFVESTDYYEKIYDTMIKKIGHGKVYLFNGGGHPAMLTNIMEFYELSIEFLK